MSRKSARCAARPALCTPAHAPRHPAGRAHTQSLGACGHPNAQRRATRCEAQMDPIPVCEPTDSTCSSPLPYPDASDDGGDGPHTPPTTAHLHHLGARASSARANISTASHNAAGEIESVHDATGRGPNDDHEDRVSPTPSPPSSPKKFRAPALDDLERCGTVQKRMPFSHALCVLPLPPTPRLIPPPPLLVNTCQSRPVHLAPNTFRASCAPDCATQRTAW